MGNQFNGETKIMISASLRAATRRTASPRGSSRHSASQRIATIVFGHYSTPRRAAHRNAPLRYAARRRTSHRSASQRNDFIWFATPPRDASRHVASHRRAPRCFAAPRIATPRNAAPPHHAAAPRFTAHRPAALRIARQHRATQRNDLLGSLLRHAPLCPRSATPRYAPRRSTSPRNATQRHRVRDNLPPFRP